MTQSLALLLLASPVTTFAAEPLELPEQAVAITNQPIPKGLAAEWRIDPDGFAWLAVDWQAMRWRFVDPGQAEHAVHISCEAAGGEPVARIPGACKVAGAPDPDALIASGRLHEVVYSVHYGSTRLIPEESTASR